MKYKTLLVLSCAVAIVGLMAPPAHAEANPPQKLYVVQEEVAQREALRAQSKHGAPYPILLVHGFMGFNRVGKLDYFFALRNIWNPTAKMYTLPPSLRFKVWKSVA